MIWFKSKNNSTDWDVGKSTLSQEVRRIPTSKGLYHRAHRDLTLDPALSQMIQALFFFLR